MIYKVVVRERGSICATITLEADFSQQAIELAIKKLGHKAKQVLVDDKPFFWTGFEYEARPVEPIITGLGGKKWNVVSV